MRPIQFVMYQPPPVNLEDGAAREEWMERAAFMKQDLHTLLAMPHDKFWCQVGQIYTYGHQSLKIALVYLSGAYIVKSTFRMVYFI